MEGEDDLAARGRAAFPWPTPRGEPGGGEPGGGGGGGGERGVRGIASSWTDAAAANAPP